MAQPKTLVLTGYGINCDDETRYAFERAGSTADIVHINDLIESPGRLDDYQIFTFPGGFHTATIREAERPWPTG
jgi:phosphoribosylformylglycinamidine synthase